MRTIIVLGALLAISFSLHAETDLAIVCTKAGIVEGAKIDACRASEVYKRPLPTDMVRSCGPTDTGKQQAGWAWRKFSTLGTDRCVDVCKTDVRYKTKVPDPWTAATDKCKSWAGPQKKDVLNILAEGSGAVKLSWAATTNNSDNTAITTPVKYIVMGGPRGQPQIGLWSGTALNIDILLPPVGDNCYNVYAETTVRSSPSSTACKRVTFPSPTEGRIEGPTDGAIEIKR